MWDVASLLKEVECMPNIAPISELIKYDQSEKNKAIARLLGELSTGFASGDAEGWILDSDLGERLALKRNMRSV